MMRRFFAGLLVALGIAAGLSFAAVTSVPSITGVAINPAPGQLAASLGADVDMVNTANYYDGPSVAQGTTGTWMASGGVTVTDTAGAANVYCKLWDGTTVIDSRAGYVGGGSQWVAISLSGYLASPAGNIRISCRDVTSTSGKIKFNTTGNSKDSTITVWKILN